MLVLLNRALTFLELASFCCAAAGGGLITRGVGLITLAGDCATRAVGFIDLAGDCATRVYGESVAGADVGGHWFCTTALDGLTDDGFACGDRT